VQALGDVDSQAGPPDWIRPWLAGVDPDLEVVGLPELGLDASERSRLRDWRAIRRLNEERGTAALQDRKGEEQSRPDQAALEQVRITNDYRVMLGRRPLLWNPRLQFAARGHSDYMARHGVLSHYEEKDPERRKPSQRARLAGYSHFQAENCSFGLPSPQEAHRAWTTSPGHHRNIVFATHTEMASSLSGAYWTQKFGRRPCDLEEEVSTGRPAGSGKRKR
ncbi:MAG: CAP domain-containing protein, partial [Planctomycetota bacterium]|nr:CAP domain-containing protein [Planctomycetota bacterium]